jgi:hypothetical protein
LDDEGLSFTCSCIVLRKLRWCSFSPTYLRTFSLGVNLSISDTHPSVTLKGHNTTAYKWITSKIVNQSHYQNRYPKVFEVKRKAFLTHNMVQVTSDEPSNNLRKRWLARSSLIPSASKYLQFKT